MLGLLSIAAVVVIILATKGARRSAAEHLFDETEDISDEAHIFAADTWVSYEYYRIKKNSMLVFKIHKIAQYKQISHLAYLCIYCDFL